MGIFQIMIGMMAIFVLGIFFPAFVVIVSLIIIYRMFKFPGILAYLALAGSFWVIGQLMTGDLWASKELVVSAFVLSCLIFTGWALRVFVRITVEFCVFIRDWIRGARKARQATAQVGANRSPTEPISLVPTSPPGSGDDAIASGADHAQEVIERAREVARLVGDPYYGQHIHVVNRLSETEEAKRYQVVVWLPSFPTPQIEAFETAEEMIDRFHQLHYGAKVWIRDTVLNLGYGEKVNENGYMTTADRGEFAEYPWHPTDKKHQGLERAVAKFNTSGEEVPF